MAAGYVSPLPVADRPNYRKRIEGNPTTERVHLWPDREGGVVACNPAGCRECERERTWKEGQTHGV